jgi:hypothetical protein
MVINNFKNPTRTIQISLYDVPSKAHTIRGAVFKSQFVHEAVEMMPGSVAGAKPVAQKVIHTWHLTFSWAFDVVFLVSTTTLWQRSRVLIALIAEDRRNFCSHLWLLAGTAN